VDLHSFSHDLCTMLFSLHPNNVDKVEKITPDNLPDASVEQSEKALEAMVDSDEADVSQGIHATVKSTSQKPWFHKLIPGIENLATKYHVGNYVAIR
jgi:phosphatidylserine decarboxylase